MSGHAPRAREWTLNLLCSTTAGGATVTLGACVTFGPAGHGGADVRYDAIVFAIFCPSRLRQPRHGLEPMKTRSVVIHTGRRFDVPQGIQRIDTVATHGWQLRYRGETKMFSDGDAGGRGAARALETATAELLRRIERLPAPTGLQRAPNQSKGSDLPVGISGPLVRTRQPTGSRYACFLVAIPRYGDKPRRASVYIGTETTYSVDRYHQALAKAIALRTEAEQAYQRDATRDKRRQARELRQRLRPRA